MGLDMIDEHVASAREDEIHETDLACLKWAHREHGVENLVGVCFATSAVVG